MRYLITGGSGLVGAYTVRHPINEGHAVVVYDLNPDSALLFKVLKEEDRAKVSMVSGDTRDLAGIMRALKDHEVQEVIHLAYMLTAGTEANPSLGVQVNILGTSNIFEAARILKLRKVVWASSSAVFGAQEDYTEERLPNDAVHKPRYLYGACKSFCEFMGHYYFTKHNLDNVGLRFTVVYGPGKYFTMTRGTVAGFASELIEKPALSDEPSVIPYGDDSIDWLYVEDAARSLYLASLAERTPKRAYTICGDLRPMREVVSCVKKILPKARIELQPGKMDLFWNFDISAAEKDIGYRPEYTVERGAEETIRLLQAGF